MIALAEGVAAIAARARACGRLGIDTEFMSEGRYQPLLCVVQVVVDDDSCEDGVRVAVIDALDERIDPAPLAAVLADPDVEVVMHAGRQDVALLKRTWRTEVRGIFDTQVAAGFAGYGAQTSYENLIASVLRVRLAKTASFTRWDVRPLTAEQVRYAREDVLHLLALAAALQERLAASGRLAWAREECRALEEVTDERDLEAIHRRLPRVSSLKPEDCAVAYELVEWRERTAVELDRPPSFVLPDAALVELAKRRPGSIEALAQIRGLHANAVRRRGRAMLAAVSRGAERAPIELERGRRALPEPTDAPLVALAEALVRSRALDAGLAYELIASRADLAPIVAAARRGAAEPEVRTLRGWRRELVGEELLELLAGRRALEVDDAGLLRVRDGHGPG